MEPAEQQLNIIELQRRLFNLIQVGTVHSADYPKALVRVALGELVTGWLPWLTARAGADRSWWAPSVGEQVVVLSPSGELVQGMVLPALFQTAHPAPGNAETLHHTAYGDGSFVEYDRATGQMTVTNNVGNTLMNSVGDLDAAVGGNAIVNAAGDVDIDAGGTATVDAASIVLNGGASGGLVCQAHVCAFTGSPHPQGSATITGGG